MQSHALSFFHLSGPDLLLGMDSDPAKRNIMGLIEKYPDVARNGIRLRQFGQKVISMLGGQSIHPAWTVPGGVREPLERRKPQRDPPHAARGARHLRGWRSTCSRTRWTTIRTKRPCTATSPACSWDW